MDRRKSLVRNCIEKGMKRNHFQKYGGAKGMLIMNKLSKSKNRYFVHDGWMQKSMSWFSIDESRILQ